MQRYVKQKIPYLWGMWSLLPEDEKNSQQAKRRQVAEQYSQYTAFPPLSILIDLHHSIH